MSTPGRTTRASARLSAKQGNNKNPSPSLTSSFLQRNNRSHSFSNGNLINQTTSAMGSAEEEDEDEYQASSNETGTEEEEPQQRHPMGLHLSAHDLVNAGTAVEKEIPRDGHTTSQTLPTGESNTNLGNIPGNKIKKSRPSFMDTLANVITSQIKSFDSPTIYDLPDHMKQQCEEAANQYIQNCKRFHINIDASVVTALQTGWYILQPSRRFTEGSMLPLMGILENNEVIKKVNLANSTMQDSRFRAAGNGNSNARIISHILQYNKNITELDLSNNGIDDDGIREICIGLARNNTLKKLNLAANHFGEVGAQSLTLAIAENSSLVELDLSRNALGFRSISTVLCACNPKGVNVGTSGNYVFEEILNSVSHGIAFIGSIIGANILISEAADTYRSDYHFWACVLYSCALMFLFLSSCLFHSFFMLPTTSRIFQILDHIGIYMVIAGSYTPILLITLNQYNSAKVLCTAQWIAAILGSTFAACSDLNNPMTTVIELSFFLVMGFGAVLIWDLLLSSICFEALILLGGCATCYLTGIVFFILGEYKPIYHAIWHVFVVMAAALHWFCVYFYIVQVSIGDSPVKSAVHDLVDSVSAAATVTASLVQSAKDMAHF